MCECDFPDDFNYVSNKISHLIMRDVNNSFFEWGIFLFMLNLIWEYIK